MPQPAYLVGTAMYTNNEHIEDKDRILEALDALVRLREQYKDVVAIPEVVTLHDITEYHIESSSGVKPFKQVFSRKVAEHALNYFNGTDYITPESFENTLICAIQDHRQQKKK